MGSQRHKLLSLNPQRLWRTLSSPSAPAVEAAMAEQVPAAMTDVLDALSESLEAVAEPAPVPVAADDIINAKEQITEQIEAQVEVEAVKELPLEAMTNGHMAAEPPLEAMLNGHSTAELSMES